VTCTCSDVTCTCSDVTAPVTAPCQSHTTTKCFRCLPKSWRQTTSTSSRPLPSDSRNGSARTEPIILPHSQRHACHTPTPPSLTPRTDPVLARGPPSPPPLPFALTHTHQTAQSTLLRKTGDTSHWSAPYHHLVHTVLAHSHHFNDPILKGVSTPCPSHPRYTCVRQSTKAGRSHRTNHTRAHRLSKHSHAHEQSPKAKDEAKEEILCCLCRFPSRRSRVV
jgi:hypothetical protein